MALKYPDLLKGNCPPRRGCLIQLLGIQWMGIPHLLGRQHIFKNYMETYTIYYNLLGSLPVKQLRLYL
jgi:hypothetical protein